MSAHGPDLRVLIVDDESVARRRLRRFLLEIGGVEIVGEADCAETARERLRHLAVDLVFLDIQMPGDDGFAVLDDLPEPAPAVVFVTAFEEHAVHAFEVEARDYVLKPFHRQRIAEALARVRRQIKDDGATRIDARAIQDMIERGGRPVGYRSRILVRGLGRVRFVPVAGVRWFEADGNYVRLHTATESHLVRATMRSLEQELDPAIFVRIHRSTIVNLQCIRELRRRASGDHQLELDSGVRLTLSRSYREAFERAVAGHPGLQGD